MSSLVVILLVFAAVIVWGMLTYNSLVKHKNFVEEGWSGIDAQLKRRSNLIPNLVEAVKGYAEHERQTLNSVTALRTQSEHSSTVGERAMTEGQLGFALGRLVAVAEDYPDLKANENFLDLQKNLADVEDEIQMSRRYYNGTVRNLNSLIDQVPSNLIAGLFRFEKAEYFEIEDEADRAVPTVSL